VPAGVAGVAVTAAVGDTSATDQSLPNPWPAIWPADLSPANR
jgi:hypothetical protein